MLCACFAALKLEDVRTCMGDPEANADNPLLKAEQDAQVGYSSALRSLFCFVTRSIHTLFLLFICLVHSLISEHFSSLPMIVSTAQNVKTIPQNSWQPISCVT
jgi:hypothetical protein